MGILSFLFSSSDSPSERGAKTDGKEITELKSANTVDAAKNLQHAKDVVSTDVNTIVIQDNKKERQKKHKQRLNTPYQRRSNRNERRQPRKRHIEVQNTTVQTKNQMQKVKKSDSQKIIADFVKSLGPDVEQAVKDRMIEQMAQRKENIIRKAQKTQAPQIKPTPINLRENESSQTNKDIKSLIEEKRGSNRESKRITMLKAAKRVAEKARKIVKDFRLRVTGKVKQAPVQKQKIRQKQRTTLRQNMKNSGRNSRGR